MLHKQPKLLNLCIAALVAGTGLAGCGNNAEEAETSAPAPAETVAPAPESEPVQEPVTEPMTMGAESTGETQITFVSAADTSQTLGTATLVPAQEGVTVRFNIAANDVITAGEHAIHIHENGSCEAQDTNNDGTPDPAGAAGGHFNPTNVGHGDDNGPHAGDSQQYNYTFAEDGSFNEEVTFPVAGMEGDQSVMKAGGTSIVIHAGTDDKQSDPAGDSGPRVACAVIGGQMGGQAQTETDML